MYGKIFISRYNEIILFSKDSFFLFLEKKSKHIACRSFSEESCCNGFFIILISFAFQNCKE